jgi:hypothetical protein
MRTSYAPPATPDGMGATAATGQTWAGTPDVARPEGEEAGRRYRQTPLLRVLTALPLLGGIGVPTLGLLLALWRWPWQTFLWGILALLLMVLLFCVIWPIMGWLTDDGLEMTALVRRWERLRKAWRVRMEEALCPHCFEKFRVADCAVVRTTPEPVNFRIVVGTVEQAAPDGLRKRVVAGWRLRRLRGPRDNRERLRRQCPVCLQALPLDIERGVNRVIGLIGPSHAGKSHYIAAVIHLMKDEGALAGLGLENLVPLDETINERFKSEYAYPLFERKVEIRPSESAQALDGGAPQKSLPLLYTAVFRRPGRLGPFYWEATREVNLLMYDAPGEQLASPTERQAYYRYVLNSEALIFLIDPQTLPNAAYQLKLLAKQAGRNVQQPQDFLEGILFDLVQQYGIEVSQKLPVTVAFTLAKLDLIEAYTPQYMLGGQRPSELPLEHYDEGYQPDEAEAIRRLAKTLLRGAAGGGLVSLGARFRAHECFAVSATGRGSTKGSFGPADIEPQRVLEPLVWMLWKLDLIAPGRSAYRPPTAGEGRTRTV